MKYFTSNIPFNGSYLLLDFIIELLRRIKRTIVKQLLDYTDLKTASKQDVIPDLEAIRFNASVGSTAVLPNNIKKINNQSLIGEGNITIEGGGNNVQPDWEQTDTEAEDYIKNKPTLFDGNYNSLSNKPTIPIIPTNISVFNNDAGYLTEQYILDNLAAVAVSGDYADLKNTPEIPIIPKKVSAFTNDAGYLTQHQSLNGYVTETWINLQGFITQHQDISGKYNKSGGNISGDVDIDGNLTLNIEDEDYDSGVKFSATLDDNLGTVLTLNGYANANDNNTNYRPVLRNIGTPNSNYDAANKKYVDDNIVIPVYHLVELNNDGSVHLKASSLTWQNISSNLTNPRKTDYLDVIWETAVGSNQFTRFYIPCVSIEEVNLGDLIFAGIIYLNNTPITMIFKLDNLDVLTTVAMIPNLETVSNKVLSVINYFDSTIKYPTTKAVFDEFQRKPVTIWETDGTGLTAISADITETVAWQLTNLDMTPYKRIKIYTKAGRKTSGVGVDASNTPGVVLEMSLDNRAAGPVGGHFLGSIVGQKPNDSNRLFTVTCAVSADKTSFAVLRMSTLYGTAATANSDVNGWVFKIEGYYD